jgi:hypothetical protein
VRIEVFAKLKLTDCANCARAGNRAGHLLEALGGPSLQSSALMFIVTCGHRRRTGADFAREILLHSISIVVYNDPT